MGRPRKRPASQGRPAEDEIRNQEVLRADRELAAYFKGRRTEREARAALKIIKAFVRDRERADPATRRPLPIVGAAKESTVARRVRGVGPTAAPAHPQVGPDSPGSASGAAPPGPDDGSPTKTRNSAMSVFTNPASGAAEHATAYVAAVLDLVGDRDPLAVMRETIEVLPQAIAGLSLPQLRQPEQPGKWSIAQVLQHLADSELVGAWRFRLILAQDRPQLTGYDQDQWADSPALRRCRSRRGARAVHGGPPRQPPPAGARDAGRSDSASASTPNAATKAWATSAASTPATICSIAARSNASAPRSDARAQPTLDYRLPTLHLDILCEPLYASPRMSTKDRLELLQGTLDLLILRTLEAGPAHGHAIAKAIEQSSDEVLRVEQGSLYPALHRLIKRKWIGFDEGTSENNRRAKFYRLTAKGRKQLAIETSNWDRLALAIGRVSEARMTKHPLSDLDGEIRDHIERETDDNIARGMPPRDARHAALRKFGSVTLAQEDARAVWIPVWLDQLRQDLRYGIRMLGRNPGFTTVAVATLALGIGLTTAVFSVMNAVLIRPLPYADGERIVLVRETLRQPGNASVGHFHDWTEHSTVFDHTAAGQGVTYNLADAGDPERIRGMRVTPGYFEVAHMPPALGRYFTASDVDFGGRVVVLSHSLWQARFGGDRAIIGRSIRLGDESHTVIGVAPAAYALTDPTRAGVTGGFSSQLWTPLMFTPEQRANFGNHYLGVLAKLKPGVTLARAQEDLERVTRGIAERHPEEMASRGVLVQSLEEQLVGSGRGPLFVLMTGVAFVLFIGCVNIASLLTARATARRREIAIRASVGGGQTRIVRQLLTESVVLALAGGARCLDRRPSRHRLSGPERAAQPATAERCGTAARSACLCVRGHRPRGDWIRPGAGDPCGAGRPRRLAARRGPNRIDRLWPRPSADAYGCRRDGDDRRAADRHGAARPQRRQASSGAARVQCSRRHHGSSRAACGPLRKRRAGVRTPTGASSRHCAAQTA